MQLPQKAILTLGSLATAVTVYLQLMQLSILKSITKKIFIFMILTIGKIESK